MSPAYLADILPEPPDGTVLVVGYANGREVIARKDLAADVYRESPQKWTADPDARWFYLAPEVTWYPRTWEEITRDAWTISALGEVLASTETSR